MSWQLCCLAETQQSCGDNCVPKQSLGTRTNGVALMTQTNSYSSQWFEFFHRPIGKERTQREVDFIAAVAPLPEFQRVLDLCCGMGRHARALSARGYAVTGIDRDATAIAKARELGGGPIYIESDIRTYRSDENAHDLAIVMSQSFGYFDDATNREILASIASGLRKGGRVILDLWQPDFFLAHQGERTLKTLSGNVREMKRMEGDRLCVELTYPDGSSEGFEWQLFTPDGIRSLAEKAGLVFVTACRNFDAGIEPNSANPGSQFVLQKP